MASAINSLPVPVSPLINTVALVGATTRTMSSTRPRAALLPTMLGNRSHRISSSGVASGKVASSNSKDAVWLVFAVSLAQLDCAAISCSSSSARCALDVHRPRITLRASFVSLPRDPLANICCTVLQHHAVPFATLQEADGLASHQGHFFEIKDYPASLRFRANEGFQLGDLFFLHFAAQTKDHLPVR